MGDVFGTQGMAAIVTGNFDILKRRRTASRTRSWLSSRTCREVTRSNRFGKVQPFVGQQVLHAMLELFILPGLMQGLLKIAETAFAGRQQIKTEVLGQGQVAQGGVDRGVPAFVPDRIAAAG
jgi:hypothetical protein